MSPILLRCDASEAIIHPQAGASIARWTWRGRPILYAPASLLHEPARVDDMASFPMVPFANRIGNGRLADGTMLAAHPGEPHALHGVGWRRIWDCLVVEADSVVLELRHVADDWWPFDFVARLDIRLGPANLRQTLTVQNTGPRTMPAGLGLHPYFPVDAGTTVTAAWTGRWTIGADLLPVERERCAALNSAKAADWTVNNCYTGWDGQVTLTYADRQVTISGDSNARFIQCYRPGPGSAFLALEPVTQVPNAHQLDAAGVTDTGLRYLRPAETMSVSIDIAVV